MQRNVWLPITLISVPLWFIPTGPVGIGPDDSTVALFPSPHHSGEKQGIFTKALLKSTELWMGIRNSTETTSFWLEAFSESISRNHAKFYFSRLINLSSHANLFSRQSNTEHFRPKAFSEKNRKVQRRQIKQFISKQYMSVYNHLALHTGERSHRAIWKILWRLIDRFLLLRW